MYDIKWDMQPTQQHEIRAALKSIKKDLEQILGKNLAWNNKVYSTHGVKDPFRLNANANGANYELEFHPSLMIDLDELS